MNLATLKYAALSAAERKKADAYAGPGDSFPLYKNGEHLAAAWDLAGHAENPDAVRAKIRAFAREHGLTHYLPEDAQPAEVAKKALTVLLLAKARSGDMAALLEMAFRHEEMEGDTPQQARLVHFAKQHGLTHLLPASAHAVMHQEGVVHEHEGVQNDEYGQHDHVVKKAFSSLEVVSKAFNPDTGIMTIEGWVSTPDPDYERDVVPAEAFLGSIDRYFDCGAPLSSEHNTRHYPVGHGQRGAVVKAGKILKEAVHPTDPADFQFFPGSGTGVYARFAITEHEASQAVYKGNVRGFSWVGKPIKTSPLPTGGRRLELIDPWLESTIAAYPVNQSAHFTAAH